MKYIIFGAGKTGKIALHYLGYWRTEFFASNSPSDDVEGKRVISYSEMLSKKDDYIIVVASEKYYGEMEEQLDKDDVVHFFTFRESDIWDINDYLPYTSLYRRKESVSYTRILSGYGIDRFDRIAIYGDNRFLPYLIAEVCFQNGWDSIVGVIKTTDEQVNTIGIPFVELEAVEDTIDCLLINERRSNSRKAAQILNAENTAYDVLDIFGIDALVPEYRHPNFEKYKDIHRGERCFLIGNGPSLLIEDLETLHRSGDVCFAFNKIFKIYDKTNWRPLYYGISDADVIPGCREALLDIKGKIFLSDEYHRIYDNRIVNAEYFHWIVEEYYPNEPGFSEDITKGTYFGYSVVYGIGIQFASYMGFSDIYLLGVDNSFTEDLTDARNHFIEDYFSEDELERYRKNSPHPQEITKAYERAEKYSRKHGFRIYNATRGGALEVFERVSFDDLFGQIRG